MYNYSRYNLKKADLFDQQGRLTEHIEFDTSGNNMLWRKTIFYGADNFITSAMFYDYMHYDSSTKKHIRRNTPDTQIVSVEYDSVKHTEHKTSKNKSGIKRYEMNSNYDIHKVDESWYYEDGASETQTRWVEKWRVTKKMTDTFHFPDGKTKGVEFLYKNHFDKSGTLTSCTVKKMSNDSATSANLYFREISFKYAKNGLLIQKDYTEPNDNGDWVATQIFSYKYW